MHFSVSVSFPNTSGSTVGVVGGRFFYDLLVFRCVCLFLASFPKASGSTMGVVGAVYFKIVLCPSINGVPCRFISQYEQLHRGRRFASEPQRLHGEVGSLNFGFWVS